MIDYLYKVGDLVVIQAPSFMNGKTGYIKELKQSFKVAYGDGSAYPSYCIHIFESGEEIVFLEESIEAIV